MTAVKTVNKARQTLKTSSFIFNSSFLLIGCGTPSFEFALETREQGVSSTCSNIFLGYSLGHAPVKNLETLDFISRAWG